MQQKHLNQIGQIAKNIILKRLKRHYYLVNKNKRKIAELEKENSKLTELFTEQETLKDLLFESGKPLEKAVTNALKILGYQAENYNDGTLEIDQVIKSPEGERYIGECEGKDNKDIDIGKFRQLLDTLNEDFEKEEIKEKANGLLFGNPQRLLQPDKRGVGFTTKCISGAAREKIGLIKTADLFNMCKYLLENNNEEYKKLYRLEIQKQLGTIINFPTVP